MTPEIQQAQSRPSEGASLAPLRAKAKGAINALPPARVMNGGVEAVRAYKDRCAVLNRFANGGALTKAVRAALAQIDASQISGAAHAEGPPLAGRCCMRVSGAGASTLPVGNHGEMFAKGQSL